MNFFKRLLIWTEAHPARAAVLTGWYQQGCGIFGAIVAIPFILKLLERNDAGLWFSLQGILMMLGLADFGFSLAVSRQAAYSLRLTDTSSRIGTPDLIETKPGWSGVSELYASSHVIFWRVTAVAAVALVLLYHAVLPHTRLIEVRSANTALVWYAMGGSILLNLQTRLSQSFLDGIGFMFLSRFISGSYALVWNVTSAIALLVAPGLLGMSLVVLGASLAQFVAMHLALSRFAGRQMNFKTPASKSLVTRLWKVALPFGFVNSGVYLVSTIQVPLLGSILGPTAVAPYYLAARISQTLGATIQQMTLTQMPLFTHQLAAGNASGARVRMTKTIWIGALLYLTATLFLYFGSPHLVKVWVGSGQYVEQGVLLLIAVNFMIGGLAVIPGHFVLASGSNPFAITTLIQGALTVIGSIYFCPLIGIAGIPLSSLIAGLCTNYWYNPFKALGVWHRLAIDK
jgi:O-antigen/teichoic acid export membrane protein